MFIYKTYNFLQNIAICCLGLFLFSCANRVSGPTGGPKDTTPPRVVKSSPKNGQMNYNKNKIDIEFDELILLEKQAQKISLSPTQKKPPIITASGKNIRITLNDSLIPNTTYTIDFSDAIVDNNERNKLTDFTFSFSTGNTLDSLQISGTLIDAFTHNPVSNATIGIYANLLPDAFLNSQPLRISKSNDEGKFTLRNLKEGEYRIVVLTDLNGNLQYDKNEYLAFSEKTFVPSSSIQQRTDTIKQKDKADSLVVKTYTAYSPSDILLRYFKEDDEQHYFVKAERKDKHKFTLFFHAPNRELPVIEPINFDLTGNYLLEQNVGKDTLSYWITSEKLLAVDTLKFKLYYLKTDSLGMLQPTTDTIRLGIRKESASPLVSTERTRRKNISQVPKTDFLKFQTNIREKIERNEFVFFEFESPIKQIKKEALSLYQKVDTVWKKLPTTLEKKDDIGLQFQLLNKWESDTEYKIDIDSTGIENIYGKYTDKFSAGFKTRAIEEYSTFTILLKNVANNGILEILNKEEKLVAKKKIIGETLTFEYLNPGDYYLRIIIDENGNGKYDAGKYSENRQPEPVYYFPHKIQLMANWEIEEEWDIAEIPILLQKPRELIKSDKK